MRVVVVGTIVADTIEHAAGGVTESLGGIAHTVSVLSALGGEWHEIVPVCRVGRDCRERVEAWARQLDGVSLEAVIWMDEPNPRVRLCYAEAAEVAGEGERVERLRDPPAPLQPADLRRAGNPDVILLNCISGDDCTPQAVAAARHASPRLYLDVHSLALGTAADGRRFYRPRDDWHAWLVAPDVVQCNRAEAATICGLSPATVTDGDAIEAVAQWMRAALPTRRALRDREPWSAALAGGTPSLWLLTLGAAGVAVLQRTGGEVAVTRVAAPAVDVVDPTGAGDAFGAAFVISWLADPDPIAAARRAVRAATAAATIPGSPAAARLREALVRVASE